MIHISLQVNCIFFESFIPRDFNLKIRCGCGLWNIFCGILFLSSCNIPFCQVQASFCTCILCDHKFYSISIINLDFAFAQVSSFVIYTINWRKSLQGDRDAMFLFLKSKTEKPFSPTLLAWLLLPSWESNSSRVWFQFCYLKTWKVKRFLSETLKKGIVCLNIVFL